MPERAGCAERRRRLWRSEGKYRAEWAAAPAPKRRASPASGEGDEKTRPLGRVPVRRGSRPREERVPWRGPSSGGRSVAFLFGLGRGREVLEAAQQVLLAHAVELDVVAVARALRRHRGGGSIINISSIAGLRGAGTAFAYGASKWAVRGMTKAAAQELAPHNIRVNSVHPGIIDTQMITEIGENWERDLLPYIPIGRVASADDVAKLVLYLASDDSAYSTGSEFVVDGGVHG